MDKRKRSRIIEGMAKRQFVLEEAAQNELRRAEGQTQTARELKRLRPLSVTFIQGDAPRYAKAPDLWEAWGIEAPLLTLREAAAHLKAPAEADWMQKVASEMNLSETAFLVHHEGGYNLRWFTPAVPRTWFGECASPPESAGTVGSSYRATRK